MEASKEKRRVRERLVFWRWRPTRPHQNPIQHQPPTIHITTTTTLCRVLQRNGVSLPGKTRVRHLDLIIVFFKTTRDVVGFLFVHRLCDAHTATNKLYGHGLKVTYLHLSLKTAIEKMERFNRRGDFCVLVNSFVTRTQRSCVYLFIYLVDSHRIVDYSVMERESTPQRLLRIFEWH